VLLTHRPDEADDLEDAAEVPSPAGEPQRDTLPELLRWASRLHVIFNG